MHWFRHGDPAYPFFWESTAQPAARWHDAGDGPAQYLANTPAGAWAEFIRHEAITDVDDLADVRRALWAIDVPSGDVASAAAPVLRKATLCGGETTYVNCRNEARRLRNAGAAALVAPSAALLAGAAAARRTDGGIQYGAPADGAVLVLFGRRADVDGWLVVVCGSLDHGLLAVTRPLSHR
jgi:hypothetical protein